MTVSLQDRALASGRSVRQPPKDRTEQGGPLRGHFRPALHLDRWRRV